MNLYDELMSFCQFISYHGGEAQLTVNGKAISMEHAEVLVKAYMEVAQR